MKYRKSYYKYIGQLSPLPSRPFYCGSREKIKHIVVIPCLAESRYILNTLLSLSKNDGYSLQNTLILCVVNNRSEALTGSEIIADNELTMAYLSMLVQGELDSSLPLDDMHTAILKKILETDLRIAFIDASSNGCEMPEKGGGVGMARKIGLDAALILFDNDEEDLRLLYCLDADTIVERTYLTHVRTFFEQEKATAACVSFAHQDAEEEKLQSAIICYEIFLRYYVLGLKYAGSPYAFHTVGSAMICTADGYAAVRGMNKRQAGEDFYFLNKISKLDGVQSIRTTTVHPSARASSRVPFGTGKAVSQYGQATDSNYLVYNPSIFTIMKQWLMLTDHLWNLNSEVILKEAERIHPALNSFLHMIEFKKIWCNLHANNNAVTFKDQFKRWFDGFITLKLINFLSRNGESPINIFEAVHQLLSMIGIGTHEKADSSYYRQIDAQKRLLNIMRAEIVF